MAIFIPMAKARGILSPVLISFLRHLTLSVILRDMKFEDECFQFGEDFYPAGVEWENCDIVPADPGVESVYYLSLIHI